MPTTVENPFDATRQASGGLVASNITGGTTSSVAAPASNTVSQYTAATRSVDPETQTAQGQVNSILSKDSPLMQRARTLATQQMAQRGLVNSSMAAGAGVAAMIDRAVPIASQDASTYNQVASENMGAVNQAGLANTGALNQFGMQKSQQDFDATQLQKQQQFTTSERLGTQKFTSQLEVAKQNFTSAQSALDRALETYKTDKSIEAQKDLQTAQQTFTAAQTALDRTQQTTMQSNQQTFQSTQANLDRIQQENLQNDQQEFQQKMTEAQQAFNKAQAELDRTQQAFLQDDMQSFQAAMQKATIPANFAGQISASLAQSIGAISADGNLTPESKKTAIQSAINYANSQVSWANKFYQTNIPDFPTQ